MGMAGYLVPTKHKEKKVNGKKVKRPDSTRTKEAKVLTVARREIRSRYVKNGGRF